MLERKPISHWIPLIFFRLGGKKRWGKLRINLATAPIKQQWSQNNKNEAILLSTPSAFIRLPFLHEHRECNNLERASVSFLFEGVQLQNSRLLFLLRKPRRREKETFTDDLSVDQLSVLSKRKKKQNMVVFLFTWRQNNLFIQRRNTVQEFVSEIASEVWVCGKILYRN